jgi:pimeloyl-ACP methyl ester carboxylesterase
MIASSPWLWPPLEDAPTGFAVVPDGRRLAFCEWGDPRGAPVVYLHGFPGSRYLRHVGTAYADAHLRVITYDRPGYGLSDAAPGRIVADTAADVATLADHLGLDRFAVVGVSAGGVHAFAVAATLPDRVTRCVGMKAIAPFEAEGLDFYEARSYSVTRTWPSSAPRCSRCWPTASVRSILLSSTRLT